MQTSKLTAGAAVLLAGASIAVPTALAAGRDAHPAAARGPKITVRIEGLKRTLLAERSLSATAITRDGHACAASSAAAALSAATRGRWSGTYSTSLSDFEVLTVDGETDNYSTTKTYWEYFVNGAAAQLGVCTEKLRAGDQVLFAAVGNTEAPGLPIEIRTVTRSGAKLKVTVDEDNAAGRPQPLSGAKVSVAGRSATTNGRGIATVAAPRRTSTLVATHAGNIRDEVIVPAARA